MSIFFKYFKDTLRFPLIRMPGIIRGLTHGGAAALDQAREDILSCREQAMPETCTTENLVRIGAGRGIRQWPNEPDDFFRERVRCARLFYALGGRPGGLEEIIRRAGAEVEIIEPQIVRAALQAVTEDERPAVMDGSWDLDGAEELKSMMGVIGLPDLNWAEFAVRINLADFHEAWMHSFIRRLVYEFKAARSLPKFIYHLDVCTAVPGTAVSGAAAAHQTTEVYALPCPTRLDGSWRLGRPAEIIALDGGWALDGFFRLGQELQPAMVERKIEDCRVRTNAAGGVSVKVRAGVPEVPKPDFNLAVKPVYVPPKLDGSWDLAGGTRLSVNITLGRSRVLDGSWRLAHGKKLSGWPLNGSWALNESWQPPEQGVFRLDGVRLIGCRNPESTTWPQARGRIAGAGKGVAGDFSIRTGSDGAARATAVAYVGKPGQVVAQPYMKLAYKAPPRTDVLDGSWSLDGKKRLAPTLTLGGARKLDGSWRLDRYYSTMIPREGEHKLDASWRLGRVLPEERAWPVVRGGETWQ